MHSSQGGANGPSMGGATGSFLLLRSGSNSINARAEIHKLCLQCHSQTGSQAANVFQPHNPPQPAPKVLGSNWDETKSFGEIGAGGDFVNEIDGGSFDPTFDGNNNALGYGHSIGKSNAVPPGNDNAIPFALTCTACHDPHGVTQNTWYNGTFPYDTSPPYGVNVYRNLIIMRGDLPCETCHNTLLLPNAPGDMANMKSWVGGITGKAGVGNYTPSYTSAGNVAIWPVYKKDGNPGTPTDNNVYDGFEDPANKVGSNLVKEGSMGEWCARCHPKMHEGTTAGSGNASGQDWKRHPANYVINNADSSEAGIDTIDWDHYNSITGGYKVPAANTNTTLSSQHYYADAEGASGDKVFCLSCHFAHAGPYRDALRWDYIAAVDAGSQVGNGVPSNRGCQQCHNR